MKKISKGIAILLIALVPFIGMNTVVASNYAGFDNGVITVGVGHDRLTRGHSVDLLSWIDANPKGALRLEGKFQDVANFLEHYYTNFMADNIVNPGDRDKLSSTLNNGVTIELIDDTLTLNPNIFTVIGGNTLITKITIIANEIDAAAHEDLLEIMAVLDGKLLTLGGNTKILVHPNVDIDDLMDLITFEAGTMINDHVVTSRSPQTSIPSALPYGMMALSGLLVTLNLKRKRK